MKVRTISSIVAILVAIPFIYYGNTAFALFVSVLGIQAYKEILDLKKSHVKIPNLIKILGLISLCFLMVGNYGNYMMFQNNISFKIILLPLLLLLLPIIFYKEKTYTNKEAFYLLGVIYLIGIFANLIISIRNDNIFVLLYLLSITVFTDSFAYIVGSLIGNNKLMPKVSPNKSWEGFYGGLVGGSIISLIIYHNLISKIDFKIVIITIILSVIGQLGDLFFSKIKRENGIKDFSNIMPGHGGILDRFDSLIFVVICYIFLTI